MRVYCFCAVRANQVSSGSAPKTRSSVPRTITEIGLFSTKRANTLPSMVASSRVSVSKAWSVTNGEREAHLNRAGLMAHLKGLKLDAAYEYLNWYQSGWQGAFIAKQGYYSSVLETVKKTMTPDEYDYWFEGKPAKVEI